MCYDRKKLTGGIFVKKVLCLILTLVITMSCFCLVGSPLSSGVIASAESFETENGVKVEMAPFLYKSTLYQMEFPSIQSYEIKEKVLQVIIQYHVKSTILHISSCSLQALQK